MLISTMQSKWIHKMTWLITIMSQQIKADFGLILEKEIEWCFPLFLIFPAFYPDSCLGECLDHLDHYFLCSWYSNYFLRSFDSEYWGFNQNYLNSWYSRYPIHTLLSSLIKNFEASIKIHSTPIFFYSIDTLV